MVTGTANKTNQDTGKAQVEVKVPPASSTGLGEQKGGAETKPERTYRQSEVDAMLGKAGQRIQAKLDAVTGERDTFKSQSETLTAEITEAKESIASLTKEIEAMSEDNPDKDAVVKLRKAREAELRAAKAERAKIADSVNEVTKWKKDQLVYTVADEFVTATGENVDMDSFMTAADKFKLSGREELEALAETMGFKPKSELSVEPKELEVPPVKPYSGVTEGGGGGKRPTLEELKASTPDQTAAKVKSGEWIIPAWRES